MTSTNKPNISIIIPTLQKNISVLTMLLNQLVLDVNINEIIVIDNSLQGINIKSEKLKVIIPQKNLYVNPAWNLGVEEAKNNYIGIVNDDLIFPKNFIFQVVDFLTKTKNIGIIGLDTIKPTKPNEFDNYPKSSKIEFLKTKERCSCWGSAIFMKKSSYQKIPEEMKIWFGDDFLFYECIKQKKDNYKILNSNVKHLHSFTSDLKEFNEIKRKDQEFYISLNPLYIRNKIYESSFLQKIFSIKNEYNHLKKNKIITILGIKIKWKNYEKAGTYKIF